MTVNVYAIATQPNNFSQVSNPCSKINILTDQLKIEFKFPIKMSCYRRWKRKSSKCFAIKEHIDPFCIQPSSYCYWTVATLWFW